VALLRDNNGEIGTWERASRAVVWARWPSAKPKRNEAKPKRSDKFRFGFVSASLEGAQAFEILETRSLRISRFCGISRGYGSIYFADFVLVDCTAASAFLKTIVEFYKIIVSQILVIGKIEARATTPRQR
jgi:hypothetical protein